MSKSILTKKLIDEQNLFRTEIMVKKQINDGIQRSFSYMKDELQISIEKSVLEGRKK